MFSFLHLYFGPCSRNVGVYFPTLHACIMHDVYIYTCSPFPVWLSQSVSPKASDAKFPLRKQDDMSPDFRLGNLTFCSNAIGKHRLGPHIFKSQTSKPPKPMSKSFFSTNFQKLRFYQNNGLSLDRRCVVPNTFPSCNQTSASKNQDFLSSTTD